MFIKCHLKLAEQELNFILNTNHIVSIAYFENRVSITTSTDVIEAEQFTFEDETHAKHAYTAFVCALESVGTTSPHITLSIIK